MDLRLGACSFEPEWRHPSWRQQLVFPDWRAQTMRQTTFETQRGIVESGYKGNFDPPPSTGPAAVRGKKSLVHILWAGLHRLFDHGQRVC